MEYSGLDKVLNNSGDGSASNSSKALAKLTSLPNLNEVVDGGLAFDKMLQNIDFILIFFY